MIRKEVGFCAEGNGESQKEKESCPELPFGETILVPEWRMYQKKLRKINIL